MRRLRLYAAVAVSMWCSTAFAQGDITSLLIARPNSYGYGFNKELAWIGGAAEAGLYGKLDLMSTVPVISVDRVSELLPEVLQYKTRISKLQYVQVAASIGATHVLYSEYEQSGAKDEFTLHIQVVDVASSETTIRESFAVKGDRFRDGLDEIAAAIISDDQIIPGASFVGDMKQLRKIGECLTGADKLVGKDAGDAAKCMEKAVKEPSPVSHGWAARLYMRAGEYKEAHTALKSLEMSMGASSSKIALMQSRCLLLQDKHAQARSVLSSENFPATLEASAAYERGLVAEGLDEFQSAQQQYNQAAQADPNDARPPMRLAALALIQKDSQTAVGYAESIASSGKSSIGEVLTSIGNGLQMTGRTDAALLAYNLAVEKDATNALAWKSLGEAQKASGDELAAAQSFIQLYELDAIQYKEYLLEAASIYEKRGKPDDARKIYDDYLSDGYSDPEVRIKLASLELRNDNCERVKVLLDRLAPPYSSDPKVNDMISACRQRDIEERAELTGVTGTTYEEAQRGSALHRFLGVGTGIITVGALAGGLVSELLLRTELDDYNQKVDRKREEWESMKKSITDKEKYRNLLYIIGGAGAALFSVNLVIAL